ncbi:hypothetical protein P4O66_016184, partial [Electrophorus voltai]
SLNGDKWLGGTFPFPPDRSSCGVELHTASSFQMLPTEVPRLSRGSDAAHPNDSLGTHDCYSIVTSCSESLRVIFYENRNFTGRSWECTSDCFDMAPHLSRCHSCRVESGCWMLYDRARFMGNEFFIKKGEYSDFWGMWGMNGWIRSCRMIPKYSGSHRMRIYEKENFMGQMMDISNDCDSFMERCSWPHGCRSCHVMDGHWLMYEYPNYKGRMWYFGPGEYRNLSRWWGIQSTRFMSMRRIMDSWY